MPKSSFSTLIMRGTREMGTEFQVPASVYLDYLKSQDRKAFMGQGGNPQHSIPIGLAQRWGEQFSYEKFGLSQPRTEYRSDPLTTKILGEVTLDTDAQRRAGEKKRKINDNMAAGYRPNGQQVAPYNDAGQFYATKNRNSIGGTTVRPPQGQNYETAYNAMDYMDPADRLNQFPANQINPKGGQGQTITRNNYTGEVMQTGGVNTYDYQEEELGPSRINIRYDPKQPIPMGARQPGYNDGMYQNRKSALRADNRQTLAAKGGLQTSRLPAFNSNKNIIQPNNSITF